MTTETSKASFIDAHLEVCTANVVKKYDPKKPASATHSLEYSRRKCAKKLWNRRAKDERTQLKVNKTIIQR